ncbi:MAG: HesA/MoeB/ThiF family protein [Eubacteriales bacterium]|nr:HesA/MoeB/ThiF family protein [Eubacteriales bacterium]
MTTLKTDVYARQICMPEIGEAGQAILARSSVLVIGAGGLGSPVLFNLAGAGVGRIAIIDRDVVAASNLNRQFLYTMADIGKCKAAVAAERLKAYHPDLQVEWFAEVLTMDRARALIPAFDLVVCAVDNLKTRRLVNQVCFELHKRLIDGGILGFSGYAVALEPGKTPCLDCLFGLSDTPRTPKVANSIGATASVIGSIEATLVILLLLGLPNPLAGEILEYHGRTLTFDRIRVEQSAHCPICQSE